MLYKMGDGGLSVGSFIWDQMSAESIVTPLTQRGLTIVLLSVKS